MLPSQQFCSLMQVGLWVVLSVQGVPISTSFVFVTFSCRLSFLHHCVKQEMECL
uniref:Uncharacterized protein n=1 Tax=Anguilla anguilla TaxID=7936 RepID=A0A0E9SZ36_ANGAN